jgi:phosphoglycolate phosphatase-like HAD superfamily hydrolase
MKNTVIAFDVDGTLIKDKHYTANMDTVVLLKLLSKLKNTEIIVWSGQGVAHCEKTVEKLGLNKYVKRCHSKNYKGLIRGVHRFIPDIVPDICIDDIHACNLGKINLIVRNK